jgi:anti-sigma factor RsiW
MSDVTCASGVDLLADYLEGVLAPDVRAAIERHVLACDRCQAFVASYQATPNVLREATDVVLPDEMRRSIEDWLRTLS